MALSIPDIGIGDVTLGGLLTPNRAPAYYTQLPKAQTALTRKYANPSLQAALAGTPPAIRRSLLNYDVTRVGRGSMPLTGRQTLGALRTAIEQKAATPPPDPGIIGRTLADLRSLVDIPHIVTGLIGEAKQLPEAPAKLGEALGAGDPREVIAALNQVPGLRLVPGVYTASTLAEGGPAALLEHPLYTALDVLPYAKAPIGKGVNLAAGRLPRVAAETARLTATGEAAAREAVNVDRLANGLKPIPTESNFRLAVRTSPTRQLLAELPLFQNISGTVLSKARDVSQFWAGPEAALRTEANVLTPEHHPGLLPDLEVARSVNRNTQTYVKTIGPERMAELSERARTGHVPDVLADPSLTDTERAFVHLLDEDSARLGNEYIKQGYLPPRLDGDIYTWQQYNRIQNIRSTVADLERVNELRNRIAAATPDDPFPAIDHAGLLDENISTNQARTMGQGYAQLVDKSGFDGDLIRKAANKRGSTKAEIVDALEQTQANPVDKPLMPLTDVMERSAAYEAAESRVGLTGARGKAYTVTREAIKDGDLGKAASNWDNTVKQRKLTGHPDAEAISDALRRYRDMDKFDRRTLKYSDERVARARNVQAKIERKNLPANYYDLMEKLLYDPESRVGPGTGGKLYELFEDDPEALQHLDAGLPELIPALRDNPGELRAAQKEIRQTAADMKDAGIRPLYIHRVSPDRVSEVLYPHLTDWIKSPTTIRERTLDVRPYHRDPTVAMSHSAVEFMARYMQERAVEQFVKVFGKDEVQAIGEIRALAERQAKGDPRKLRLEVDRRVNRNYELYNPTTYFDEVPARLRLAPNQTVYLPKAIDIAMKHLFPKDPTYRFASALDPVMNLFRTSVLAYRPSFHANNVMGGAMIMGLEEPGTIPYLMKNWTAIKRFNESGERANIPGAPPAGMGFYPNEIKDWVGKTTVADRLAAIHDLQGANTARRWLGEMRGAVGTVTDKLKAGADWSYRGNQWVDDLYRSTAYKYGFDKALKKGMSTEEAQAAGIALERKILPEWDRYTPFERNIIRSFFPFYSFSRFLLNYALHFPFDHPYRVSVMSSIARNEMDDFGDWLPTDFAKMFFVGKPDRNGIVRAITPGAMNPFQDVASMFTLGGIMGRTNPLISAVFKSVGINPAKGSQELYPDVSYDPQTGRLKPNNPNLLSSIVGSIVPQTQIVSALIGRNNNFAEMLHSNPEAAATMLRGGIGLPNIYRDVNVPQEAFKAEVGRQSVQDQIKNQALKTGNWEAAMKYPGLRPFFTRLEKVMKEKPELLKAYQSQITGPGLGDALKMALIERTVPV